MAALTSQVRVESVTNADLAAFVTALNTALAAYDGSGVQGSANQNKSVNNIDIFYNGAEYVAIIQVQQYAVPS